MPSLINSSSSIAHPSRVRSSVSPTQSQSSTNTKKEMPRPAALARSLSAMLSIRAQNSRGLSTYPNGSAVAHMSRPVPGCLTTNRFLLSSLTGTWKNPSRMSYFAMNEPGLSTWRTSHGDGSPKGADATYRFVPTE